LARRHLIGGERRTVPTLLFLFINIGDQALPQRPSSTIFRQRVCQMELAAVVRELNEECSDAGNTTTFTEASQ
jgi:hypothetical protein